MQQLSASEINLVSGGLPNTGSQVALALGDGMFSFAAGFINGFLRAF